MSSLPFVASPLVKRVAAGSFWSLLGDLAVRAATFASAFITARMLGVRDFGAFALVQSTVLMFSAFAQFGMGHTASRYAAMLRNKDPSRLAGIAGLVLRFALFSGLTMALVILASAQYIAMSVMGESELTGLLQLLAPIVVFQSLSSVMTGFIIGFERFRKITHINFGAGLLTFTLIVLGVWIWGLQGAVLGMLAAELIRFVIIIIAAHSVMHENGLPLIGRADYHEIGILLDFSLPLVLGAAFMSPVMWACQAIIAVQPEGLAQVGLFNAGQRMMTLVNMAAMSISAAFVPIIANIFGNGEIDKLRILGFRLMLLLLAVVAIPATIVASLSSYAAGLFGDEFKKADEIIFLMMFLAPIFVLKHFYWQLLTSCGYTWSTFRLQIMWGGIAVLMTWVLRNHGGLGLAQALLIAYGVNLFVFILQWSRIVQSCKQGAGKRKHENE